MKNFSNLDDNWIITAYKDTDDLTNIDLEGIITDKKRAVYKAKIPLQVHEVLIEYNAIKNPAENLSDASECIWVSKSDWLYIKQFELDIKEQNKYFLNFKGLDTVADVYLNGHHIHYHINMFLPSRIEITRFLKSINILSLHFYSPLKYIEDYEIPLEWEGRIERDHLIRKANHDFGNFLGAKPYFVPVGVYDDILLEEVASAEIDYIDIEYMLNKERSKAELAVNTNICIYNKGIEYITTIKVYDPEGKIVERQTKQVNESSKSNQKIVINDIKLWWPKFYGEQNLYKVEIDLKENDKLLDSVVKNIGFRDVNMIGMFDFEINGAKVKLWGGNLVPLDGNTHCYNEERANKILDLADNCNFNTLRVWGGGEVYKQHLYEEADKRGLLLWVEFYFKWGMYPNDDEFNNEYIKEAKYIVKQLKHHPSVLFWCGGNESLMGVEFDSEENKYIGREIFEVILKDVCESIDPKRYYHPNSPIYGAFFNDPQAGDTHGYAHKWHVRGSDYPIMLAENTRASTPMLYSIEKMLGHQNIWPEDYDGRCVHGSKHPLPKTWQKIAFPEEEKEFVARVEYAEKFYDVFDADSLVYKLGNAHGLYLRRSSERMRRGRPHWDVNGDRRCMGSYVWKLNDCWPQIYSSVTDFYLEPNIAYYWLKRAYEPVLLSFDIDDYINLWAINDTAKDVEGEVVFKLFNPVINKFTDTIIKDAKIKKGESKIIMNLNSLNMIDRENLLFAELIDKNGNQITRSLDYLDLERKMNFPKAKLSISQQEDSLIIMTDKFARCVYLFGGTGNEFGWFFEDNYFDLLPGERKIVKVLGKNSGVVYAKAYYSEYITKTIFNGRR